MFKKDNFLIGFAIGFLVPAIVFGLIMGGIKLSGKHLQESFFENVSLLLIALDALVMRYFLVTRKQDYTGRGVVAAMFVLIFIWVILYQF